MRIASWSLLVGLGLGGSMSLVMGAIAPQVTLAYTARLNIALERQPNESYDTLVRRAEAVARAAAQRSFDNDILATEAEILVTGQNIGLSAPILSLAVNRDNWKNRPDARRWSTYYPNSKQLLRIEDAIATTSTPQPDANTQPPATQPTPPADSGVPTVPNSPQPSNGTGLIDRARGVQDTINNPAADTPKPQ
jgi:hypothetical protein